MFLIIVKSLAINSNPDGSNTAYNAIDPAMIRDTDGRVYMSYGSFFGGLAVTIKSGGRNGVEPIQPWT